MTQALYAHMNNKTIKNKKKMPLRFDVNIYYHIIQCVLQLILSQN
jgi:hypothetical protein